MQFSVTILGADGATPIASRQYPLDALPEMLLSMAGGGYTTAQTAQAMQWNDLFNERGVLEVKAKNRRLKLERTYDSEVPAYCTVHGLDDAEPQMLDAALTRLKRLQRVVSADIFVQKRVPPDAPAHQSPGWCEYLVVARFEGGGQLTLGILQRKPGAQIESHS